ncbi:phenylalanine--tRNA ligase subunit alpha [Candidatus Uhrbacteria bacterium]|nr:phenylalanine--tRNA ligase subunit alpha [Candidatus Uhrbacteria bacterium]
MQHQFEQLKKEALVALTSARDADALRAWEILYLGRKGKLAQLMEKLGTLSVEEKKKVGPIANAVKQELTQAIEVKRTSPGDGRSSPGDGFDTTLPGVRPPQGHLHPVTQAIQEIEDIFSRIGFHRARHPEVDTDWYAFESLNMPADHPARDEWETYFIESPNHRNTESQKLVLTPHTSNGQVRELEKGKLPIRMVNISKCYRRQSDVSHVPMFHQFEGVYVDEHVTFQHLKGVFEYFIHEFFGPKRTYRLRPFHFRFTEPSVEVDVQCDVCNGTGKNCRLCKNGWLELAGGGMMHPNVLKAGGVDPKKYTAFAFGFGVERSYMMKSGLKVDDIRILYKNDLRFLEQF